MLEAKSTRRGPGPRERVVPRSMARRLTLRFEDAAAFRKEYRENIVQGGAFVRTPEPFGQREPVVVAVELAFAGVVTELDAEVVHSVPTERAGAGAGVAVQFLVQAAELRERFERYVPAAGRGASPEVDDPSARDLFEAGVEVEAGVGERGGRRRRQRGKARVPATLETTHVSLHGRTRDLSESGVLLSVDGNDLPLGKPVLLTLVHPDTGERFEVRGRVARRVEAPGTVAAVAIDFETSDGAASLAGFVRDVQALEARRRAGGISGSIGELGMGALIQMFGKFSRAGTLTASFGSEEGVVAFEGGALRYCRIGSLSGTKALARLLSWEDGEFEFHSEVDPLPEEAEPLALEGALLEAVRQIDEMRRVEPATLDPSARLHLDAKALASHDGPLSKTEEAVVDLAAAGLTVRRLLDVIPESDSQILEAIRSLADCGLVEIRSDDDEE
jgi:Tfp pilus assembly protein PilZ